MTALTVLSASLVLLAMPGVVVYAVAGVLVALLVGALAYAALRDRGSSGGGSWAG